MGSLSANSGLVVSPLNRGLVYCGTEHRPTKLAGYGKEAEQKLREFAEQTLMSLDPPASVVISGMALGWDTALAAAAIALGIPLHAYIPFEGQQSAWPQASRDYYNELLAKADKVVYVCPPGYAAWKMQKRNEAMVNSAGTVLALWDGSSGGTANCVKYASDTGAEILNVWDEWLEFR